MEHLSTPLIKTGKLHTHPLSLIVEHTPVVYNMCDLFCRFSTQYQTSLGNTIGRYAQYYAVHVCRSIYRNSSMTYLSAYDYKTTLVSLKSLGPSSEREPEV